MPKKSVNKKKRAPARETGKECAPIYLDIKYDSLDSKPNTKCTKYEIKVFTQFPEQRTFKFPTGDVYLGYFAVDADNKKIVRQGFGIYKTWDGIEYCGEWSKDKLVGLKSKIFYPDNSSYCGSLNDVPEYLKGCYTFKNGFQIKGDFKQNFFKGAKEVRFTDQNNKLWCHCYRPKNYFLQLKYTNWSNEENEKCDEE